MSKLIMEALAFDSGKAGGVNVEATNNSVDSYIESALVSLASARRENPDCDIVLYCNEPVEGHHAEVAECFGIKLENVPFDNYVFSPGLPWHLAYYKLCALEHAVSTKRSLDPMWISTRVL